MTSATVWNPSKSDIEKTRLFSFMKKRDLASYDDLHRWSVEHRDEFWKTVIAEMGIRFQKPYREVMDLSDGVTRPKWCTGGILNIAESCFPEKALFGEIAIVEANESTPGTLRSWTYAELWDRSQAIASAIRAWGWKPGDALAVDLPMTGESVALYLGIILSGCVAVSIADSFAPHEISVRLKIAHARGVFTQDTIDRGGKKIPLYSKVREATEERTVLLRSGAENLRPQDLSWEQFLSKAKIDRSKPIAEPASPDRAINILFSSGTTGEPKAIPWTHTTPIKCAMDGMFHQDIGPGTVVAWPTNLGWMMGPWLIFATLIHRGTVALFDGAPHTKLFGEFVSRARVQVLGVIPSLVKAWRNSGCMEGLDWSAIRCFSSTGECSNESDMGYLMNLAGGKPVIEYCGGTEIGGGYITGTMVQSQRAATFSTPAMGLSFELPEGEIALIGPSIGLSTTLLNKDHDEVYFDGMPSGSNGEVLRRHGDQIEVLGGGYFRALGRVDDTMNLGGIKVSSAEIERTLNKVAGVLETAAIAVNPQGGGPSLLVVFAVSRAEADPSQRPPVQILQKALSSELNPLFKIHDLVWVDSLPRTASNKVMRRVLRDQYGSGSKQT